MPRARAWGQYASRMAQTVERTCYRHPDRVTGLSCSECGRPICTECMTPAPVGIRCPDHSGRAQGTARVRQNVRRVGYQGTGIVTRLLIALNVGVYVLEFIQTGSWTETSGSIFGKGVLYGPAVAQGDWWRLITAAFLHYNAIHLFMNMLGLYWFGTALELRLGAARYLALYLVSGLAGSAGALVLSPLAVTVGASGAIFGILGAMLILEWQTTGRLGGNALTLIVINLPLSFAIANISIGGHVGGLIGGLLATLA